MVDRGRTRHSIARSVTGSTMLTTGVALVLACAVFVAWDTRVGRRDLVEKGELLGQVVGSHSAVALQFHDRNLDRFPFEQLLDQSFPLRETKAALAQSAARTLVRATIVM